MNALVIARKYFFK